VIYYGGCKFTQKAEVLLLLGSDAACTGLNGHSAQKSAGFFFLNDASKPEGIEKKIVKVLTA